MNRDERHAPQPERIRRILTLEANDALTQRLDEFSPDADRAYPRVIRTLGARTLTLTNDVDRGPWGVGEGLALKKQERALNDYPHPHRFALSSDRPHRAAAMLLEEGALLRLYLDLDDAETQALNRKPMFDGRERPDLYYFVSRRHLVGRVALEKSLGRLRDSIAEGDSFVTRPRIVEPTLKGWSHAFTPRRASGQARRPAA